MKFKHLIPLSLVAMALFIGQATILPSQAASEPAKPLLGLPLPPDMSQAIVNEAGITPEQQAKMQEISEKPPAALSPQTPPPNFGAAFLANTANEKELRSYFTWMEKNSSWQAQMADTFLEMRGVLSPVQQDKLFAYVKAHPLPPLPKEIQQQTQKNPLAAQIDELLAGIPLTPPQAQKLALLKAAFNKPSKMDPNTFPLAIANLIKTGNKETFTETSKATIDPLPVNELVGGIMSLNHAQRVKIAARFEELMKKQNGNQK